MLSPFVLFLLFDWAMFVSGLSCCKTDSQTLTPSEQSFSTDSKTE